MTKIPFSPNSLHRARVLVFSRGRKDMLRRVRAIGRCASFKNARAS